MPFVKGAQITLKDNLLEIVFETEMGENIFGVMNLGRLAERFLCDTYGIQVAARTTVSGLSLIHISVDEIDEQMISDHLETSGQPDPDFMIRTSGEERLSN